MDVVRDLLPAVLGEIESHYTRDAKPPGVGIGGLRDYRCRGRRRLLTLVFFYKQLITLHGAISRPDDELLFYVIDARRLLRHQLFEPAQAVCDESCSRCPT